MKIFDLHCHPTLKPMLSLPKDRPTPWETIKVSLDDFASNIYDSQSNFNQMLEGGCNLACVGLMALESEFVKRCIVKLLAGPIRYIDRKQVKRIAKAKEGATYSALLNQEINSVFKNPENHDNQELHVKFISSMDEYDETDTTTLYLIPSLEGGHGLYYGRDEFEDPEPIIQKIAALRKGDPVRLLYLSLAHISQNALANHAFAVKIFKKTHFFPQGNGLTPLGRRVIETCQTPNIDAKPVLIDIKHLSLVSRLEVYKDYGHNPFVASHMAVTGCSYKEKPIFKVRSRVHQGVYKVKYQKQKGYLPDTMFNPDSMNLYDEDIENILQSGGIIGLILDERVLGYSGNIVTSKEFVSNAEWDRFIAPDSKDFEEMDDEEDLIDDLDDEATADIEKASFGGEPKDLSRNKGYLHNLFLLNNIMHIIKVGDKIGNGIDPRKQITLGSDFDGLINAVDSCTSADQTPQLAQELKVLIDEHASDLIPDSQQFIEDFFYNNGLAFVKKNF